ncbi:hypothetical protein QMQ05_09835 [Glutamicibacter ectropisis]|uniref:Uncharacterized protein n=1 Tax=Glutamicibacter ectropisis TaxID=3046593 RepID=A0AAU6WAG7_9MICC
MSQAEQPQSAKRERMKRSLWVLAQAVAGIAIGLAMAKSMALPEEQVALIGTLITLVTWLGDEVFKLPAKDTKAGAFIHGSLRLLALIGFIMALQSLAALNGFSR